MKKKAISLDQIKAFKFIKELETELNLPKKFFICLLRNDDWSFIIKIHTLIDVAITKAVIETLGKPEIEDSIERLNLNTKLGFAKKLNLLEKDSLLFVQKLSEMRNQFAHNISDVGVEILEFLNSSKKEKRDGFLKAFRWGNTKAEEIIVKEEDRTLQNLLKILAFNFADELPKIAIWTGSLLVLRETHHKITMSKFEKEKIEIDHKMSELINTLLG